MTGAPARHGREADGSIAQAKQPRAQHSLFLLHCWVLREHDVRRDASVSADLVKEGPHWQLRGFWLIFRNSVRFAFATAQLELQSLWLWRTEADFTEFTVWRFS